MSTEYTSYESADIAAKEMSIKHPGIGHYVSWIDIETYIVTIFEDYPFQSFWMNGNLYYPDDEE